MLPGLLKLSHAEKLRVVNLLLREIAAEEGVNLDHDAPPMESADMMNFLAFVATQRVRVESVAIPNRDERNAR